MEAVAEEVIQDRQKTLAIDLRNEQLAILKARVKLNTECITTFAEIVVAYMFSDPEIVDGYSKLIDILKAQNERFINEFRAITTCRSSADQAFIRWP